MFKCQSIYCCNGGVYLLIAYISILKKLEFKNIIILFLIVIVSILSIQFETFQVTQNMIYEREYDEEYDNQANKSIILKIDIHEIIKNPFWVNKEDKDFYNKNASSLWNILILDTFGDYLISSSALKSFQKTERMYL